MDKSAIRNFAIEARKMLMKSAETEAGFYGVTKNGCKSPIQKGNDFEVYETIAGTENRIYGADIKRRANLVKAVETLGFEQVIEETAYTWFNRIIAIRFMEVNDYLPTRVRVLSSETGSNTPDIVTQSLDVDLNMTPEELEKVQKAKDENRYDDAFRMLFIKQCNELNAILPGLFEKTDDYMELLLKLSYTSDGVVRMLVDSIDENNFNVETEGQVEIIGWMYQYYISEKHEEIINIYKGTVKKEDIPAATQLFTTDWVVKYMVDNSLGRYWLERNQESKLQEKMDYFVAGKSGVVRNLNTVINPEEITFFDPCMGSGHILVYAFELLMEIYRECGYSDRDAAESILKNNIYGMDIDKRAYQLAYFAVLMKARAYSRRILKSNINVNIVCIEESNSIYNSLNIDYSLEPEEERVGKYLVTSFLHAKEIGSLVSVNKENYEGLVDALKNQNLDSGQISFEAYDWESNIKPLLIKLAEQAEILSKKYSVVCTNPPYMGKLEGNLKEFVVREYKPYSGDLFSVFMYRNFSFTTANGYLGFMTPFVWMFIKSYEELRNFIIEEKDITTLVQMEYSAFEEATVPICSFVLRNGKEHIKGAYFRLSDFKGGMEVQRRKVLEAINNVECGYYYETKVDEFIKIPSSPIAYWLSERMLNIYQYPSVLSQSKPCKGIDTGDNNRFLRLWYEVDYGNIKLPQKEELVEGDFHYKWYPYNKGGAYRKWYGNNEYVLNWGRDGAELKSFKGSNLRNKDYYFKKGITWSTITSGGLSLRYFENGYLFDNGGCCLFADNNLKYILAFLNSSITKFLMSLSPTINSQPGDIGRLPLLINQDYVDEIVALADKCISISKEDWDEYETSWDFLRNPLIGKGENLETAYLHWEQDCARRLETLKECEERINSIFIDMYNIKGEVSQIVDVDTINIHRETKTGAVKDLISYAVGCMFGRYSIDCDGIMYAGGNWDNRHYAAFTPDQDGIIPITDANYFSDDIVTRFELFLINTFGREHLEENINFIANSLQQKGETSREIIRNYFLNEFYKDHCNMYSVTGSGKRPIYWLFDSGKQNGFKCLIYMHRYNKDTLNLIRSEYLHKTEDAVENALKNAEYIIQTSTSAVERAKATKDRDRYVKQLNEMRIYYQALSHLALQKIEINLDDGVKHNYQLFQGIEVIADGGKKQKVDLLAKI